MSAAKPFFVNIPVEKQNWVQAKLEDIQWPDTPEEAGWAYGADLDYMKELVTYWRDVYDWRQNEASMNRFNHFKAEVTAKGADPLNVHFIHEKGSGSNPMPLILTHGWPGSFYEFDHLIEQLAHPEQFGGNAEDGFDVIVPSLFGYGFSDKPKTPMGVQKTADYWHDLMTRVLGYEKFSVQGGDWGSLVSSWVAQRYPESVIGCHLNMAILLYWDKGDVPPAFGASNVGETDEERAWEAALGQSLYAEGGYFHMHATKPVTLNYALLNHPVATAAWIVEKFYTWGDTNGDIESKFTKDQLLTNVMIYILTDTIGTSTWYYTAGAAGPDMYLPKGERINVPCGMAVFDKDFIAWPPRSLLERSCDIARWTEMPSGGHFAAMEEPELFLKDVQDFFRDLR